MSTLLLAALLPVLVVGFVLGWAAHRSDSRDYTESRARWLAQQMVAPPLPPVYLDEPMAPLQPVYDDVIDAEVVLVEATRLDRLEVEA